MATKEHRRFARGLIEGLELRVHSGPPIGATEIDSAQEFLRQNFSPASDYFSRLCQIKERLNGRSHERTLAPGKRNYGGEAGGRLMQVQSIYDHVILSTCYAGEFNTKRGRVKVSHRFNSEGRIDFVELKFLRSMSPWLTGEIRKLVMVKDYQNLQRDWHEADAFTLRVLPQELIFLYGDIFRCARNEILAWLMNIGHGLMSDLRTDLLNGRVRCATETETTNGQLCLTEIAEDGVARTILEKAASLESRVEMANDESVLVRYRGV